MCPAVLLLVPEASEAQAKTSFPLPWLGSVQLLIHYSALHFSDIAQLSLMDKDRWYGYVWICVTVWLPQVCMWVSVELNH